MGDNKKFSEIIAIEVLEENESRTKKNFFFKLIDSSISWNTKQEKNVNKITSRHIIIQLQETKDRNISKQPE